MKICVTSTGTGLESSVDPRFGRAQHLLLVDTETSEAQALEGATGAVRGAGVVAAQAVVRSGAEAVITGQLGPNAFEILSAAKIPVYGAAGAAVDAAIRYLAEGRLAELTRAEGQPHMGPAR